jgi:hypothetical protein
MRKPGTAVPRGSGLERVPQRRHPSHNGCANGAYAKFVLPGRTHDGLEELRLSHNPRFVCLPIL